MARHALLGCRCISSVRRAPSQCALGRSAAPPCDDRGQSAPLPRGGWPAAIGTAPPPVRAAADEDDEKGHHGESHAHCDERARARAASRARLWRRACHRPLDARQLDTWHRLDLGGREGFKGLEGLEDLRSIGAVGRWRPQGSDEGARFGLARCEQQDRELDAGGGDAHFHTLEWERVGERKVTSDAEAARLVKVFHRATKRVAHLGGVELPGTLRRSQLGRWRWEWTGWRERWCGRRYGKRR